MSPDAPIMMAIPLKPSPRKKPITIDELAFGIQKDFCPFR
jgi:hypothetical protein